MFLPIHVDNGFIIGISESMIEEFLKQINKTYSIKTKKKRTQHLGYTLSWQLNGSIVIHQQDFFMKIIYELNIMSSNSINTPAPTNIHNVMEHTSTPFSKYKMQKAIGMINYLALQTLPDIIFTTNLISQFVSEPTTTNWNLVKHLL
ncbi:hypothetical protein O181_066883 [Austropuccinia psidii MF-1]|uniref:Reverse transcriptase Ty1/copia-type domain-containing protein n=1 Tax=Austropuccinia psidii MF-1 TaxID=1389203 RepID=A0A9Q3I405_9BASI|nr:hypothetical protein [Austropuccinia psidii MF-1]